MIYNLRAVERNIIWLPKAASTALAKNSTVGWSSGDLVNAATEIVGVIKRDVVSTDSDYATAHVPVPVEIWEPNALYYADVTAGGNATIANIGVKYDIDTSTSPYLGINLGGTSNKVFLILQILSTTQVVGQLIGSNWNDLS
jgi:hypothetical protein